MLSLVCQGTCQYVTACPHPPALQALTDPRISGHNAAERVFAQALRILLPLFMLHIMSAFVLAILLDPYCLLRIKYRGSPGVPTVRRERGGRGTRCRYVDMQYQAVKACSVTPMT